MITGMSPLPDALVKWGRCNLLHEKTPMFFDEVIEGKRVRKIKWICKECQNDHDTSKDQEASETQAASIR